MRVRICVQKLGRTHLRAACEALKARLNRRQTCTSVSSSLRKGRGAGQHCELLSMIDLSHSSHGPSSQRRRVVADIILLPTNLRRVPPLQRSRAAQQCSWCPFTPVLLADAPVVLGPLVIAPGSRVVTCLSLHATDSRDGGRWIVCRVGRDHAVVWGEFATSRKQPPHVRLIMLSSL